jgi:hypothetical protein
MKRSLRISYSTVVLFVLLAAGCSAPPDSSNPTGNTNATVNTNAPALTPQTATPQATSTPTSAAPPATATAPVAQPAPPAPATVKPAETATKPAPADKEARVEGPKLVLISQEKELDFGKQPQDKTLVKAIRIKNGGSVPLNIESVAPS